MLRVMCANILIFSQQTVFRPQHPLLRFARPVIGAAPAPSFLCHPGGSLRGTAKRANANGGLPRGKAAARAVLRTAKSSKTKITSKHYPHMKKLTIGIAGSFRYDAHPHAATQKNGAARQGRPVFMRNRTDGANTPTRNRRRRVRCRGYRTDSRRTCSTSTRSPASSCRRPAAPSCRGRRGESPPRSSRSFR